jgi:PAS domain-containing protein
MVLVNQAGEIVLVNAQTVTLFGWTAEELLGRKIEMLLPALDATEQRIGLGRDGAEFPVEVSSAPLLTAEGTLVMSSIRNITERKAAEDQIKRLNRVYAVLSGINSLIVRPPTATRCSARPARSPWSTASSRSRGSGWWTGSR